MKTFDINPKAPPEMVAQSRRLYDAIGGALAVKANQAWNRFSVAPRQSGYFVQRADKRFAVSINGSQIDRVGTYAEYHWGKAKRSYHGPNGEHELYWRMPFEQLANSVVAVMNGSYETVDINLEEVYTNDSLTGFDKEAVAKARIGHSVFAKAVKARYGQACAVQPGITRNLIAAHIKPWSLCDDREKVDTNNGISLSPNMDGLFEDGSISFSDNGQLIASPELSADEMVAYKLTGLERITVHEGQQIYLKWHRDNKLNRP